MASSLDILQKEMEWLSAVIEQVIKSYFLQEDHEKEWIDIPLPDLSKQKDPYSSYVNKWRLGLLERLALALAIAPHFRPEVLDIFFGKNRIYDRGFTEFGGVTDKNHSGFLPTGQTFYFLATAVHPELRPDAANLLLVDHVLMKEQVLLLIETDAGIPAQNGLFSISKKWFHYFLTGKELQQENTSSFPAQKITTNMEWKDVVLDSSVHEQVMELKLWAEHGHVLMNEWGLHKQLKPGYRALFYGPPGTGKTLTATLLGKTTGKDVYKIDLSLIVSKWVGETEKNLSALFDIARYKDWILFFDEADALFGKRTSAASSNDRFANQQTAYLLQRIEDFPGMVILASNLRANMDEAFTRRFQSIIHFDMPGPEERYQLWTTIFSGKCRLHRDIDLYKIAEEYEMPGGVIINILRSCALAAIKRKDPIVQSKELMDAIRKELKKENKTAAIFN